MKKNKVIATLASSVMLAGGILAVNSVQNDLSTVQTVQAARTYRITLKHNAAYYNARGKRVGKSVVKKGRTLKAYGTKTIKHKKYYRVGGREYIKASNARIAKSTKASSKSTHMFTSGDYYRLKHNAYIYNARGKRVGKTTLKKNSYVYVQGSATIRGKKHLQVANGEYIVAANAKPMIWHSSTTTNTNEPVNNNHSSNTSSNSSTTNTSKPTNNSSKSQSNSSKSESNNNHPEYSLDNPDNFPNYLTNNVEHVKQLVLDKINAARQRTKWYAPSTSMHGMCQPYKTNSEIQAMADMRAKEAMTLFNHVRPNGESMRSVDEYIKLLPNTSKLFKNGFPLGAGETLSGVYASKTDEETADGLFNQLMRDDAHRAVLLSDDSRVGYAAVGLQFDPKGGYCMAFEMIGGNYWEK